MHSQRPKFLRDSDPYLFGEFTSLLARPPLRWEIYYSDGTVVEGSTPQEWAQAPNTDVQVVIWQDHTQQIAVISMLDNYLGKQGTWMEDVDFDALLKRAPLISKIM